MAQQTILSGAGVLWEAEKDKLNSNFDEAYAHEAAVNNPHSVTATQVGLGNCDDTSDANKPVSTATQTALDLKADATAVSNVDNTADADKPVSTATQTALDLKADATAISNMDNTSDADKPVSTATQTALDLKADSSALTAHTGSSSNPHSVDATQVGLGSVDNTADADKPVSTATQTALDAKQDRAITTAVYSSNQTLTVNECFGAVIYVDGAATITLPAIQAGMSVTIITLGAVAVMIDPDGSESITLNGVPLTGGNRITNTSTTGDTAVLTYQVAGTWYASTNDWTDEGS